MTSDPVFAGSFRDPAGRVFEHEGRILRNVTRAGAAAFDAVRASGLLDQLVAQNRLVRYQVISEPGLASRFADSAYVMEHPKLEYISYPYEWIFEQLRVAALFHLDLALDALAAGMTLSDATAYNVQYVGARPVFIDHLSFRPYRDGEFWLAHRQFCEHFLNPLLLRAELGIPHNAWYRGALEGIPSDSITLLLPSFARLSLRMNVHVFLPARYQRRMQGEALQAAERTTLGRGLPRRGYEGLLRQLRNWIAGLNPRHSGRSVWGGYAEDNNYAGAEAAAKQRVVAEFAATHRPALMLDLGCNSGLFAETAITAGAGAVVGFDFDQQALDKAYRRAADKSLPFLPLFLDAANPSPSQGWAEAERMGFSVRTRADAVLALAFIHHLVIGRNIPLDQVVAWIVARAPVGLVEFVPKSDPTSRAMLRFRDLAFEDYTEDAFVACLSRHAEVTKRTEITSAGRAIYEYRAHSPP